MDIARRVTTSPRRPARGYPSGLSLVTSQQDHAVMPTSDELNELARNVALYGDRQAFSVLFKHFAPRLKTFLMRSGSPEGVAEDLAQETMVNVWRKASSFDPVRAQLSTWIFTIARNLRIDQLRRQGGGTLDGDAATPEAEADHAQLADPAPALDEQLGTERRERRVRAALASLSTEQALLVRMSFFDDQPHARIADELKLPLGTVKSRIRLALNHLRRLLDDSSS